MLVKDEKQTIIKKFAREKGDTGSPEVQVALLSAKIEKLAEHLKEHKKDIHSRRGLLSMIAKRRRLLTYLQKKDEVRYKDLIKGLKLEKWQPSLSSRATTRDLYKREEKWKRSRKRLN